MIKLWDFQGHLLFRNENIWQRIPTSCHILSTFLTLSFSVSLTFSCGSKCISKIIKPYILEGNRLFFNHLTLGKVLLRVACLENAFGSYLHTILLRSCHCLGFWQVRHLLTTHRTGQMTNHGTSVSFMVWSEAQRTGKRAHHTEAGSFWVLLQDLTCRLWESFIFGF